MKIRIVNNSSRELPEELAEACIEKSLTTVNNIAEEYLLKVKEYEQIIEDNNIVEIIYTIGNKS